MRDFDSNDVETAGYLARQDAFPDDRPSPDEYSDDYHDAPDDREYDVNGWVIANQYRNERDR